MSSCLRLVAALGVVVVTACTPTSPTSAAPTVVPSAPAASSANTATFPPRPGDDAPTAALRRVVGPQVSAILVLPDQVLVEAPDHRGFRLRGQEVQPLGPDSTEVPIGGDPFPLEAFPLAEVQARLNGRQARITRESDNDPVLGFGSGMRIGESAPGDEDAGVTETWLPGWRAVPKFDLTTRKGLADAVDEVGAQAGPRLTSFVYELGPKSGVTMIDQSGTGWHRREVFPLTRMGTAPPMNQPFERSKISVDAVERIITTCRDEKPEGTGIRIEAVSRGGKFGYEITVPTDGAAIVADADQSGRVTFH